MLRSIAPTAAAKAAYRRLPIHTLPTILQVVAPHAAPAAMLFSDERRTESRHGRSAPAASRPQIVGRLNQADKRLPYARRIKPFNFLLAAHIAPFGHPRGADPARFQLIAPFTTDASRWTKMIL